MGVVVGADLDHPLIDLNCRHRRVCGEQMAGQRALAGPQLDHAEPIVIAGSERAQRVVQPLDDPARDRRVGEEVLAEALLGLGPVAVPARRRSDAVQAGRPRQWQLGRRQERNGRQPAPHARGLRSSVRPRREGGNSRGNAVNSYGTCATTLVTSEDGSRGHPRGRRWEVCSASLVRSQADGARVAVLVRSLAHLE